MLLALANWKGFLLKTQIEQSKFYKERVVERKNRSKFARCKLLRRNNAAKQKLENV